MGKECIDFPVGKVNGGLTRLSFHQAVNALFGTLALLLKTGQVEIYI